MNLAVADGLIKLRDDWSVPARPMIGCLATTPARETVFSRHEGSYGGNLDVPRDHSRGDRRARGRGSGRGLYFGDCKAAIGDGEIVCAPECATTIRARAGPLDRPAGMSAPRIITMDRLTTVVSAASLTDAASSAFRELKIWLEHEWGLTSDEAAVLMGIGAHCGIGQVSNLLHTAKCSLDRSLLPPGDAGESTRPGGRAHEARARRCLLGRGPELARDPGGQSGLPRLRT